MSRSACECCDNEDYDRNEWEHITVASLAEYSNAPLGSMSDGGERSDSITPHLGINPGQVKPPGCCWGLGFPQVEGYRNVSAEIKVECECSEFSFLICDCIPRSGFTKFCGSPVTHIYIRDVFYLFAEIDCIDILNHYDIVISAVISKSVDLCEVPKPATERGFALVGYIVIPLMRMDVRREYDAPGRVCKLHIGSLFL